MVGLVVVVVVVVEVVVVAFVIIVSLLVGVTVMLLNVPFTVDQLVAFRGLAVVKFVAASGVVSAVESVGTMEELSVV